METNIKDREELVFLLSEAAEFEHTVMCSYLYALMSLKRSTDEGVTDAELAAIERWRKQIRIVALEEMLHLCLVNNLLTAFGSAAHFARPDFPVPAGRFPADIELKLSPFNEDTVQHFAFIEKPLEIDLPDGTAFRHLHHYHREIRTDLVSPTPTDYASQGHLYHAIANGIDALAEKLGEDILFAGHGEAQVGGAQFALPGLFAVTDLASAHRAIEEIVIQGEGAPAHSEDSHYARFAGILEELKQLKVARPAFEPARPALVNPRLIDVIHKNSATTVTDPLAIRVVDLGNSLYTLMLRTFVQVFAPNPLPQALRTGLAQAATAMMVALTAVGEAATRLPCKRHGTAGNAGLSFELPGSIGPLVQHCAAQVLGERATQLAALARTLEKELHLPGVADSLESVATRLKKLHANFEEHFSADTATLPRTVQAVAPATHPVPAPLRQDPDNPNVASTDAIRIHYDTKRCIHSRNCVLNAPRVFLANVVGPWLHPEETTPEQMANIARDCPSGAITYERLDSGPQEAAPEVNVLRVRENGPYAVHATIALEGQEPMFRATLCRCGKSKNKPFCDSSHLAAGFTATGERAVIEASPLESRCGELAIDPTPNGPLEFTGNLEICGGTGHTIQRVQTARLCRCGGSANKPFCDNTHAKIGFRSDQ
ncbi:MAG: CDGSH iron-sulfur domain-containing protein [Rhodoferax sp.]|nr:CDGSH iron-sulfur domain-containing protein [Rhodoferax sp.]